MAAALLSAQVHMEWITWGVFGYVCKCDEGVDHNANH